MSLCQGVYPPWEITQSTDCLRTKSLYRYVSLYVWSISHFMFFNVQGSVSISDFQVSHFLCLGQVFLFFLSSAMYNFYFYPVSIIASFFLAILFYVLCPNVSFFPISCQGHVTFPLFMIGSMPHFPFFFFNVWSNDSPLFTFDSVFFFPFLCLWHVTFLLFIFVTQLFHFSLFMFGQMFLVILVMFGACCVPPFYV